MSNGKACVTIEPTPDKNKGSMCPAGGDFGNPINAGVGNKHQEEIDFSQGQGRLVFARTYNSMGSSSGNRFMLAQTQSPTTWTMFNGTPSMGDPGLSVSPTPEYGVIDNMWSHTYSRYISLNWFTKVARANVLRPDGKRVAFNVENGLISADVDVSERLVAIKDSNQRIVGWRFFSLRNEVETFDAASGWLMAIQSLDGYSQTITYDEASRLASVEDNFGRRIQFVYGEHSELKSVIAPDGDEYQFVYDSKQILSGVTYPGGASRLYVYDEPALSPTSGFSGLLTGIQDENSSRFAIFSYDNKGRAVQSEHAGGADRVTLQASRFATGYLYSLNTIDALGAIRTHQFSELLGVARLTSTSQPGGSGCYASSNSITYDANGNLKMFSDFSGNKTSVDQYDLSRNLELHRIEGYGSTTALSIATQWHPYWRLKTRVAEPKLITTWVYNGQPDPTAGGAVANCAPANAKVLDQPIAVLCRRVEQATSDETGSLGFDAVTVGTPRVWGYTYNQYGQVLSEDGPRTDVADVTTYSYYADTAFNAAGEGHTMGDLQKITNAAGQVTLFVAYDRAGRLRRKQDANGTLTALSYTPRGWLASTLVSYQGQDRLTTYDYDKVGQLKRVILPGNYSVQYTYDAAHRLTDLADSLGNSIHYTLDAAGNRLKEETKDASGVLVRETQRVFDQLGRLQNVKVAQ